MTPLRSLSFAALLAFAGAPLSFAQAGPSSPETVLLAALPDAPMPQQTSAPAAQQNSSSSAQQSSSSSAQQSSSSSSAQDTASPDSTAPLPNETEEQRRARLHAEAEQEVRQEEKQRVAVVVPGFNIVMNGQAAPLSPKEKFSIVFHSLRDPYYFGIAAIDAGVGELQGSHAGYGWGASGYFKRMGAAYADNADGALIGNAILPVLWHQDPRYFRKGTGSVSSRMLHAALSTFVCRGDNGKTQGNYSNVVGNFLAGAVSNVYYPAADRGVGLTLENGASVTLWGAVGAQLLEFGPDLNKLLHHKKKQPPTQP